MVAGRVHMAAPAQRAVSGARRERNSNKHKRLFLPNEPGGLIVSVSLAASTLLTHCLAQKCLYFSNSAIRGATMGLHRQYTSSHGTSIAKASKQQALMR